MNVYVEVVPFTYMYMYIVFEIALYVFVTLSCEFSQLSVRMCFISRVLLSISLLL